MKPTGGRQRPWPMAHRGGGIYWNILEYKEYSKYETNWGKAETMAHGTEGGWNIWNIVNINPVQGTIMINNRKCQ